MQEELSLREVVRATGARLQLLVQGAEIAGATTASPLYESPKPKPKPNLNPEPHPEPHPKPQPHPN